MTVCTATGKTSLLDSLRIQKRVIGALLMREILTRYGRHNIGFLWLFIEPMIFTMIIGFVWSVIRGREDRYGIPIFAFAITGYSAVLLWRNMPTHCMGALKSNTGLLYHRTVKGIDIYASRLLLEFAGATVAFVVLASIFCWIGLMPLPNDPIKVMLGWAMLAWFGVALAMFIAPLAEEYEIVDRIWRPISYILFPLSGAIFMVAYLPPTFQKYVLLLPMVHGVECIRDGFYGNMVETIYDIPYMAACNLGLLVVGLSLYRTMSRNISLN